MEWLHLSCAATSATVRVTVNAHVFYDGNVQAAGAGDFIRDVVLPDIKRVCIAGSNNIIAFDHFKAGDERYLQIYLLSRLLR